MSESAEAQTGVLQQQLCRSCKAQPAAAKQHYSAVALPRGCMHTGCAGSQSTADGLTADGAGKCAGVGVHVTLRVYSTQLQVCWLPTTADQRTTTDCQGPGEREDVGVHVPQLRRHAVSLMAVLAT